MSDTRPTMGTITFGPGMGESKPISMASIREAIQAIKSADESARVVRAIEDHVAAKAELICTQLHAEIVGLRKERDHLRAQIGHAVCGSCKDRDHLLDCLHDSLTCDSARSVLAGGEW